jgi:hypothetical protein
MTVHVDYTRLHEQVPHLTLEESAGGFFSAIDQHGRLFTPPSRNMDVPIRLMRAMALKGHATLDEGSITWFQALRQQGEFSVGVGTLSERESEAFPGSATGEGGRTRNNAQTSRSESVQKVEGDPVGEVWNLVSRAVLGEPASPSTSVAGKDGVGTDGVSPSDRGGCAAAPAPISPPHLRLVS